MVYGLRLQRPRLALTRASIAHGGNGGVGNRGSGSVCGSASIRGSQCMSMKR